MAITTKDNVLKIASELSLVDDDSWNLILADAENHISVTHFGVFAEEAARYWVAHRLTILSDSKIRDASGPIKKDKVGEVMKEFSENKTLNSSLYDYNKTGYGVTFLKIRSGIIPGIHSVKPGI